MLDLLKEIKELFYRKKKKEKEDYLKRKSALNDGIAKAFAEYNKVYTTEIEFKKDVLYNNVNMLWYGIYAMSISDAISKAKQINNNYEEFESARAKGFPTLVLEINQLIQGFFNKEGSRYKVRCTIKQFSKDEKNDHYEVCNVLSQEKSKFYSSENSAFAYIFSNVNERPEITYIRNDIVNEVANGTYLNKRINKECTEKYLEDYKHEANDKFGKEAWEKIGLLSRKMSGMETEHINLKWLDCWSGYSGEPADINDCYRSTVVLPITMNTSLINMEMKSALKLEHKTHVVVLGFLCIDHPESGYFKDDDAINALQEIASKLATVLYSVIKVQFDQSYVSAEEVSAIANNANSLKSYLSSIQDDSMGIAIPTDVIEENPTKRITS